MWGRGFFESKTRGQSVDERIESWKVHRCNAAMICNENLKAKTLLLYIHRRHRDCNCIYEYRIQGPSIHCTVRYTQHYHAFIPSSSIELKFGKPPSQRRRHEKKDSASLTPHCAQTVCLIDLQVSIWALLLGAVTAECSRAEAPGN